MNTLGSLLGGGIVAFHVGCTTLENVDVTDGDSFCEILDTPEDRDVGWWDAECAACGLPITLALEALDAYQREVGRTCVPTAIATDRIKLALIGMQDELGELAGPLKKYLWHGHPLDIPHLQEEVGDLLWYVTLLCTELDIRLREVFETNIEKLQQRYPDGFSEEASRNRPV